MMSAANGRILTLNIEIDGTLRAHIQSEVEEIAIGSRGTARQIYRCPTIINLEWRLIPEFVNPKYWNGWRLEYTGKENT